MMVYTFITVAVQCGVSQLHHERHDRVAGQLGQLWGAYPGDWLRGECRRWPRDRGPLMGEIKNSGNKTSIVKTILCRVAHCISHTVIAQWQTNWSHWIYSNSVQYIYCYILPFQIWSGSVRINLSEPDPINLQTMVIRKKKKEKYRWWRKACFFVL